MISTVPYICPHCKGELQTTQNVFLCVLCNETFSFHEGIYSFITTQKQKEIEPFLTQYRIVRQAEGRGSEDPKYYLKLPNGGSPEWKIREASSRTALKELHNHFKNSGIKNPHVADIGAGNCWFTRLLAERKYDTFAIDIFEDDRDGLQAGRHYINSLDVPFDRVAAHFDELPFPDLFFDAIIFNASLHYSQDKVKTLHEAMRVLKPGGVILAFDSPLYKSKAAAEMMLSERREYHRTYIGTSADVLTSSYLLTGDIPEWQDTLSVKIERKSIFYGLWWMVRPFLAWIRGRREPASFGLLKITKRKR